MNEHVFGKHHVGFPNTLNYGALDLFIGPKFWYSPGKSFSTSITNYGLQDEEDS